MHYLDGDKIDFSAYLKATDPQQKVKPAGLWLDEIGDDLKSPVRERQVLLPWASSHGEFNFRDGEVTIYAGTNGSGKSLITGQIALGLIQQGESVCIASFEMKPKRTLLRMLRQFVGMNLETLPDDERIRQSKIALGQMKQFTDGKLWLYDQQRTVDPEQVIAVSRYCATELGIKHMFIDNLMKVVKGEDDYNGQKDFVDEITSLARDHAIHVHLVHHLKKLQTEESVPNKNDIKGSGSVTDQVDNAFLVWRNKKKENQRKSGQPVSEVDPDAMLMCCKQRNGEEEGWYKLWFDRESSQFVDEPRSGAMPFLNTKIGARNERRAVRQFSEGL